MRFLIFSISLIMAISAWGQASSTETGVSESQSILSDNEKTTMTGLAEKMKGMSKEEKKAFKKSVKEDLMPPLPPGSSANESLVSGAASSPSIFESTPLQNTAQQTVLSGSGANQNDRLSKKNDKFLKTVTTFDSIKNLLDSSETIHEFLTGMYPYLISGDDIFIQNQIKKHIHLLRPEKLPTLTFEKGLITLISDAKEITLRRKSDTDFDINGTNVRFESSIDPQTRWNLLKTVPAANKTSLISFLPVAFASENDEVPSISNLVLFAFLSRYVKSSSVLNANLRIGKNTTPVERIWKISKNLKGLASKMSCSTDLIIQLSQKLAEINASTVSCHRGDFIFELPGLNSTSHKFVLSKNGKKLELVDNAGKAQMTFMKSVTMDSFAPQQGEHMKVLRMKGASWTTVGSADEQKSSYIEHVRELVNFAVYSEFCGRCESFLTKAIIQAVKDSAEHDSESRAKVRATPIKTDNQSSQTNPQVATPPQSPVQQTQAPVQPPPPAQDLGAPQMMDLPPDMK